MARVIELKEFREVYAAGIDPAQLARDPIILHQNGEPVGAVISIDEYQAYLAWKKKTIEDEFPPEWYVEKAAFQGMLPELLKTHNGKWVAIFHGELVDSDDKEGELIWRGEQKLGEEPFFVDQVLETPRVYRIPSVWLKHP
jgi:hypothetical protein